jgi:hypothetical protein
MPENSPVVASLTMHLERAPRSAASLCASDKGVPNPGVWTEAVIDRPAALKKLFS